MTVEDQRSENDMSLEQFPAGMRVLAVDDDPICLKVLENLLRKCQYQVTISNQAIMALKMLRENPNKFDLVISDVNMPDMDGFKLLEHVGLEMDLPVIMLSAHSDTNLVMKGITHGACDYLLKPVRIEELKNIWQHVVRRRKSGLKDQNKSSGHDKARLGSEESGKGVASDGHMDHQKAKLNRKRKDQDEDEDEYEEDEDEDDMCENEDPSSQKKPRVVWSPELHKKFVDAVSYLGYGNAFPKKILDVMNVEGLTRENVASHLQKFRMYLKRMSVAETQQANSSLGVKSINSRIGNNALSPLVTHPGLLGRLNSPNSLTIRGITSNELLQPSNSLYLSNSFNAHGKIQSSLPSSQNANLFHGISSSWELSPLKLQQTKFSNQIGETNPLSNNRTSFSLQVGFPDTKATLVSPNTASNSSSSALLLQRSQQQNFGSGVLGNQSFVKAAPSNSLPYDTGINGSSNFLDHNRLTDAWQVGAVQSATFASTSLPMSEPSNHSQIMAPNNLATPSTASHISNNPLDFPSATSLSTPLMDTRGDLLGIVQNSNFTARSVFVGSDNHNVNPYLSAMNSLNQSLDHQNNPACSKSFDASIVDQLNGCTTNAFVSNEIEKSTTGGVPMPNEDYLVGQEKAQDALIPNNYGALDEYMDAMMRRDQNDATLMNGDFGFDNFPLGSCI